MWENLPGFFHISTGSRSVYDTTVKNEVFLYYKPTSRPGQKPVPEEYCQINTGQEPLPGRFG